jgi:hypothetical protein
MAKTRVCVGLMVGCLLAWGGAATAAAPSVAQMLSFHPKQAGLAVSTPSAKEQEQCKVELVNNGSGWLLRDPQGRPLRRFYASHGSKRVNVWSYYLDGVEVYREMDTTGKGVVDQYRWLNTGGMKWGVDANGDGKIDSWRLISAEEVSQEVLQAVITHDFNRLQAMWITDAEMKALELSQAEIDRLHALRSQAAAKFESTVTKLNLGPQTRWERLESTGPQCIPADQTGMKHDLLKHPRAAILYESAGKHDWLQTGEMIQVGLAWRLVDAPSPSTDGMATGDPVASDPALQGLMDELRKLDATPLPKGSDTPGPNADIVRYNLQRAGIVDKIIAKITRPEDRDQWTRQLADCLSAAAQSSAEGDKSAYERLVKLEGEVVKAQPGTPVAAYVTFREMSADYAGKLVKPTPDFAKVQEQWIARLAKFIQDFPQAEDDPDALLQLGSVNELLGKETEAKKWYQQLVSKFGDKKPFADKAAGALRRLDLEGKPLELAGTTVDGKPFNVSTLAGKVVVVYYWASWNQQSVGDFARLKMLLTKYGSNGVELVSVNLDSAPPEAGGPSVPGIQLAHPGGLDGPMATQYGILLPPTVFLVGKDGRVVSRNAQVPSLEEEIKKLMK